jgi:hypothetical protein
MNCLIQAYDISNGHLKHIYKYFIKVLSVLTIKNMATMRIFGVRPKWGKFNNL